ncbi:MAG TPA: hypothetical protein PLW44_06940 [Chitinophagales bacterium]|nr:hypothetical protein [Chitinophagales bacterium]
MKYIPLLLLVVLLAATQCNKPEPAGPDYRDAFTGTYQTSSYTETAQFSPLPVYDSLLYNNDTVYLTVLKSSVQQNDIVINNDTLRYLSKNETTTRFSSGPVDKTHYALFRNDSLWYIIEDTATATQYRAIGWIGPKQ